ncbi:10475_t:CDS:2 [Funneliformis mosseae]|uniref:10475_t:CDS:1 n=1 Tax=Funneliformis mosseae TaxID=27381 RepID=A0A9N8VYE4_FUNMO|nr:10475_t:CDS:2 [Funneliformis mosseae]
MGPVVDSNEAMRCEYISTILHTAVSILSDLVITSQANIIGEENTGCVDYAIKKIISEMLEEIICITEGKQNQATMDEIEPQSSVFSNTINLVSNVYEMTDDEEQDNEVPEGSDQNNVLVESTTSIPLAHDSNSSDNSKEVSPSNPLEADGDFYKMLLRDFDKEVDSTPQMMNEITSYMFSLLSKIPARYASSNIFSLLPKITARCISINARMEDSMGNVFNVTLSHWNVNLSAEELRKQNAIVQELALRMLKSHHHYTSSSVSRRAIAKRTVEERTTPKKTIVKRRSVRIKT